MDSALSLLEWSIWPWIAAIVGFFGGGVFAITQAVSGHVRNFRADLEASGEETHADRRLNAANALIAPSWWSYYLKGLRSGLDILNRWMGTLREPGRGFAWCLAAAFIYPISLLLTGWLFGGPAAIGATEMLPPADQLSVLRRLLLVAWTVMVSVAFFLIVRNAKRIDDWWQARLDRLLFDRLPDSHRNTAKRALPWAIGLVVFAILYGWLGLPLVINPATK